MSAPTFEPQHPKDSHSGLRSPLSTAAREATLTRVQHAALEALTRGNSIADSARRCGVEERVLRQWLRDPIFRSALHHLQADLWFEVTARLQDAAQRAVAVLLDMVENAEKPADRLRACRTLLQFALQSVRTDVLQVCLAQVEKDLETHLQTGH